MEYILEVQNWVYNAGILGLCKSLKWSVKEEIINESDYKIEGYKLILNENVVKLFPEIYTKYLLESYATKNIDKKGFEYYKNEYREQIKKLISICEEKEKKQTDKQGSYSFEETNKKSLNKILLPLCTKEERSNFKTYGIKKDKNGNEVGTTLEEMKNKLKEILIESTDSNIWVWIWSKVVAPVLKNNFYGQKKFLNISSVHGSKEELYDSVFKDISGYVKIKKEKIKNLHLCDCCGSEYDISDLKQFDDFNFQILGESENENWNISRSKNLLCPICRMVYLCIPFGCNRNGLFQSFINNAESVEELIKVNEAFNSESFQVTKNKLSILNSEYIEFKGEYGNGAMPTSNKIMVYRFNKKIEKILLTGKYPINNIDFRNIIFKDLNMDSILLRTIKECIKDGDKYFTIYKYLGLSILKNSFNGVDFMEKEYNEKKMQLNSCKTIGKKLKEKCNSINQENKIKKIVYEIMNIAKFKNNDDLALTILNNCINLDVKNLTEYEMYSLSSDTLTLTEKCSAIIGGMICIEKKTDNEKNNNINNEYK